MCGEKKNVVITREQQAQIAPVRQEKRCGRHGSGIFRFGMQFRVFVAGLTYSFSIDSRVGDFCRDRGGRGQEERTSPQRMRSSNQRRGQAQDIEH